MQLFKRYCPHGIKLKVANYIENPSRNPPIQLIFSATNLHDQKALRQFKAKVADKLGISIDVNHGWLHATLLYKNVPQSITQNSLILSRQKAQEVIGQEFYFDEYAFTTGKAWNPVDIALWQQVNTKSFSSLR